MILSNQFAIPKEFKVHVDTYTYSIKCVLDCRGTNYKQNLHMCSIWKINKAFNSWSLPNLTMATLNFMCDM